MKKCTLEDVCEKKVSNILQKDVDEHKGQYPIFGASGLIGHVDFYEQERPYIAVVKDGAGVGRIFLLPPYSSVIGTMQYILPRNVVYIHYLYYAMQYMNLGKYYKGAAIPHIYFKDYKEEPLKLPAIEIQKKLADNLDSVNRMLFACKKQLAKFDTLVKSRFIEMFGDPVTNPMGWERDLLKNLGELNRGVSKHRPRNAPELLNGPYPLVQTGDVSNADTYITDYSSTYSELGLKQSRMWSKGTLCITIAANIAKTGILAFDACFPDSVVGFIAGKRSNQRYIHHWFSFFQKILEEQAPQSAQKNINLQILSNLSVTVPPIALQNQFAAFVQQVDKSKSVLQKLLEKQELLRAALMQEYFG